MARSTARQRHVAYLAYLAMEAQALGHRVVANCGQRHAHDGTVGRVVKTTNDHPSAREEGQGRSTVAVHFESGVTIPVEQIQELERAD